MVGLLGAALAVALAVCSIASAGAPTIEFRVVADYPHDPNAFTQGLVFHDGALYESTGRRGRSSLREVDPTTGRVLRQRDLADTVFAEGLAIDGEFAVQVTWTSGRAFVYRLDDFSLERIHRYKGEGWGLASQDGRLVMSDGSSILKFRDPLTFDVVAELEVKDGGRPVSALNELEAANGVLFANIWRSNRIARIDPITGDVTGWLDIRALVDRERTRGKIDVANGIAWDGSHLLVTGKLWTRVYALELLN